MQPPARTGFHRPTLIIGVGLFALAAVTWFDARSMTIRANYGMGADAASYFVAAFLAALGAGHLIAAMRPGSVIFDLAAETGGNVEGSRPGETVDVGGVKVVGARAMGSRTAPASSVLYAKNLFAFVETMIDKDSKALAINWDDELVKATLLTRDGAVVHPNFAATN